MTRPLESDTLTDLLTVRDWLRWAVTQMNRHHATIGQGSLTIWDDAVFLVLRSLDLPIEQLEPYLDAKLLPTERQLLLERIEQRCLEKIPTPYLVGEAWLQGHRFRVSPDVLIPRSPISELLMTGLECWLPDAESVSRVADICTGSACLAILAALQYPNAQVDATDISEAALAIAAQNVHDYGLTDRLKLHRGHLLTALPVGLTYDLIVCNPPYVNAESMNNLPAEFEHEPSMALAGGSDGMDLVRDIVACAGSHLTTDGVLVLEIGHEVDHFEAAFPTLEPIWLDTQATSNQVMLLTADQLKP